MLSMQCAGGLSRKGCTESKHASSWEPIERSGCRVAELQRQGAGGGAEKSACRGAWGFCGFSLARQLKNRIGCSRKWPRWVAANKCGNPLTLHEPILGSLLLSLLLRGKVHIL